MKILAGEHGGRRLRAPKGIATRPMLSMVRESIFQIATPWLDGGRVLDLFSGSGSLGLEALSRGAASARFFEKGPEARAALEGNIELLEVGDRAQVVSGDALSANLWGGGPFDLVLMDPPFPLVREAAGQKRVLDALSALVDGPLDEEGLIVLHTPRRALEEGAFPAALGRTVRIHGEQAIWYLQPR